MAVRLPEREKAIHADDHEAHRVDVFKCSLTTATTNPEDYVQFASRLAQDSCAHPRACLIWGEHGSFFVGLEASQVQRPNASPQDLLLRHTTMTQYDNHHQIQLQLDRCARTCVQAPIRDRCFRLPVTPRSRTTTHHHKCIIDHRKHKQCKRKVAILA